MGSYCRDIAAATEAVDAAIERIPYTEVTFEEQVALP